MFVKQSHSTMPPSLWLHVDGVSVPSDAHQFQPPVRSYDYQTKHLQSPAQSPTPMLVSPTTNLSYGVTTIDGPYSHHNAHKQQRILEDVDMPKKVFKDRHIKKVKSLPGLIKGTALSRHTPSQTSTFTSPAPSATSANTLPDDQLPIVVFENGDDGLPIPQVLEQPNEIRRPRVNFADYNKIQFIEENDELSQQQQIPINDEPRQSRIRLSRKTSNPSNLAHTTPTIQRSPHRQNFTCPTSRHPCQQAGPESSTDRKHLLTTARAQPSYVANLPDIVSQTMPSERYTHERYILQREKPVSRLQKPSIAVTNNLAFEMAPEITYGSHGRSSPIPDSSLGSQKSDSGDSDPGQLHIGNSAMSSSTTASRHRPPLRTISLRQQFVSPNKSKSTDVPSLTIANLHPHHQPQQQHQANKPVPNTQRSTSLKISSTRNPDNSDDHPSSESLASLEKRSTTGHESNRQPKRSYMVHYNSKKPLGGSTITYPHESNRPSNRSHSSDPLDETFQNMLTIVRPPYSLNTGTPSTKSTPLSTGSIMTTTGDSRSVRNSNMRVPLEFNMTSNTITI